MLALVAALAAILLGIIGSGATAATAETRVRASAYPNGTTSRGLYDYDHTRRLVETARGRQAAERRVGDAAAGLAAVQRSDVAAETVPEALSFGSRAAAREGLPGDLAAVGNRFFRAATAKSQDFEAIGLPGGGYRLQFFSRADNPGYGKLYVQEIDRTGNILRRYKDTIGPDGFIERKPVQ